jgi:tetratricopeptide (TPR) repeat protein
MGRFAESIDMHTRLLDQQADDVAAANLGTAYFYLGRMDEAVGAYRRAVELGPGLPVHKTNLADALEAVGESESAREWYERALGDYDAQLTHAAEGRKGEMLCRRAYCAAKLGRFTEAEQNVSDGLGRSPEDLELLFEAARVYAMAGKREPMYEHVRRAVEAGYPRGLILDDPTFQAYRGERRFLDLLTGAGSGR